MKVRHVMILASAGSGKTYALTNRFVGLLARGARPDRIVALTFTRKAAGEFFDEILHKLARAARDPEFAAQLGRDVGQPRLSPPDFLRLLRDVVEAMPRLRLGTLDGFFASIARAFPFELGLTGEFQVLQEHSARLERRRVLQQIFARGSSSLEKPQREFVEAFKRATFGVEEKQLGRRLDAFLDEHQETFLAAPAASLWGASTRIWPAGNAWLPAPSRTSAEAVSTLRALLASRGLTEKQVARWEAFFSALSEWSPGAPLPAPVEYVLKNLFAVWSDVRRGAAEMTVERKKVALGPAECAELVTIVQHLVAAELTRRLETTQGIHAIVRSYEAVYHDAVRRRGSLTFADVQRLLMPGVNGATLTREPEQASGRLFVDFRLDAQFDHWLLDEFQDTSFGQWSVLRNLIDEVVQDPAGARSFFCVGDVKQAIFTWREGDPRLFREIFEAYNRLAPGLIAEEHLVQSWRSGPPIIAMVNAVFGQGQVLGRFFPGPAGAAWNREWRAHESARPHLGGHAAWLHADDEAARLELTVRLLQEIAPWHGGLDCAVLTQTNAMAAAIADHLRRVGGIPAVAESDLHVCTDNPLGAALLAMAQAAAHPGDTLAQAHWGMSPLRDVMAAEGITMPEHLTRRLLTQCHSDGFERTMEYWLRRLEPMLAPDDAFSRERGRQFVAAAALFDATGSRDASEFVAFMQRHTMRDMEIPGVVRVMTIHKSKGLGFDVVILPDLEGQRIDQRRNGLAVQRGPDRAVQWVLELPPKLIHSQDEILRAHVEAAEADAGYEALSLFYVALTRAKRALYAISKPVGGSESRNYPKLLAETLGTARAPIRVGDVHCTGGWSAGDPDWRRHCGEGLRKPTSVDEIAPIDPTGTERGQRRVARRASGARHGVLGGAQLFTSGGGEAADFGTAVHARLAQVEWDNSPEVQRLAAEGRDGDEAARAALACLRAREMSDVWRRRANAEVWRERAFEVVLDDAWITGVFDRVMIERDTTGRVLRATVFDFKTDRVEGEAGINAAVARHTAQLQLYRRVVAILVGVPPETVSAEIVFTHIQRRVRLPQA